MKTENLPRVKVEKKRGEQVRKALKELKLLRTDAKITSDVDFIYLPLIRALKEDEIGEIGVDELLTREFEVFEQRKNIEDVVGFKPPFEIIGDIAVLTDADSINERNEQLVAHAILKLHKNIKVVAKQISPVEGGILILSPREIASPGENGFLTLIKLIIPGAHTVRTMYALLCLRRTGLKCLYLLARRN